jgi:exonuclease SbcC
MIKSLKLFYFQGHKATELVFHAGINAICGSSDTGKSSLIRAIRWVVENRPSGEEFRSNFATDKTTKIELETDADTIIRERGKGTNTYKLNNMVFSAFGQEVPEEISQKLNFHDINIQYQMDSPFLLSESPGGVAKYLNKIVNLDKIDTVLQNITSKKRRNEQEIKYLQEKLNEQDLLIKKFPDLFETESKIKWLEQQQEELQSYSFTKESLLEIINEIKPIEKQLAETKQITKFTNNVRYLEGVVTEKRNLEIRYDVLFKLLRNIKEHRDQLQKYSKESCLGPHLAELENILREKEELTYTKKELTALINEIKECYLDLKQTRDFIMKQSQLFNESITEYCDIYEAICPLYSK